MIRNVTRLIHDLRPGPPKTCDYCGLTFDEPMIPDEADTWICHDCYNRDLVLIQTKSDQTEADHD